MLSTIPHPIFEETRPKVSILSMCEFLNVFARVFEGTLIQGRSGIAEVPCRHPTTTILSCPFSHGEFLL